MYESGKQIALDRRNMRPSDHEARRDLSVMLDQVGHVSLESGEIGNAVDRYTESLSIAEDLASWDSDNEMWYGDQARSLEYVGNAHMARRDFTSAMISYKKALYIRNEMIESNASTELRRGLAYSYHKVGKAAFSLENYNAAIEAFEASQSIFMEQETDTDVLEALAVNFRMLAVSFRKVKKFDAALDHCRNGRRISRELPATQIVRWKSMSKQLDDLCKSLKREMLSGESVQ